MDTQPHVSAWNLPNALTVSRVVLVPIFLFAMWQDTPGHWWLALGLFILAAITDKVDGHLARSRGQVTDFGKMADTLADKLLVGGALVGLSWFGQVWWWVTILIIAREVAVSVIKSWIAKKDAAISASQGGRIKMVLQVLGICILLVPAASFLPDGFARAVWIIGTVVLLASLVLSMTTAWDYYRKAKQVVATP